MNRTASTCLVLLTVFAVGWVVHVSAGVLQPLILALFLVGVIQPVVRGLERKGIPPLLTLTVCVGLAMVALVQGVDLIRGSLRDFSDTAANPVGTATVSPGPASNQPADAADVDSAWQTMVANLGLRLEASFVPEDLVDSLTKYLVELDFGTVMIELIGGGVGFGKGLFLVVLYMAFILAELASFRRKIELMDGTRGDVSEFVGQVSRDIQRYLSVKTLVSIGTGLVAYTVLRILEVPYAPLFGFVTFVLNFVPYFGSFIAGGLAIITALATGLPYQTVVLILITYVGVNIFFGNMLEPRILGMRLNLSPLAVLVSVIAWSSMWGVIGMVIAVPVTATIQIALLRSESTRPIALLLASRPDRIQLSRPKVIKRDVASFELGALRRLLAIESRGVSRSEGARRLRSHGAPLLPASCQWSAPWRLAWCGWSAPRGVRPPARRG